MMISHTQNHELELRKKISPALLLIDDPDETVSSHIIEHLISFGGSIAPIIRTELKGQDNPIAYRTLHTVLSSIRTSSLEDLTNYIERHRSKNTTIDLFTTFELLSHFGFPETKAWIIDAHLNALADSVRDDIIITCATNEQSRINSLNSVFFTQYNYRPPTSHYYLPEHCYLHSVIEHKIGIPLALSILYMLVAKKCGIVLQGIGMPLHFLVKSPDLPTFIDVYNYGISITKEDCYNFLAKSHIPYQEKMINAVSYEDMIIRMLRNLQYCYKREEMDWEYEHIERVLTDLTIQNA